MSVHSRTIGQVDSMIVRGVVLTNRLANSGLLVAIDAGQVVNDNH